MRIWKALQALEEEAHMSIPMKEEVFPRPGGYKVYRGILVQVSVVIVAVGIVKAALHHRYITVFGFCYPVHQGSPLCMDRL